MSDEIDISQGATVRFVHHDGEHVGTVNGEKLLHNGELYVPVYVRDGDRCLVVHYSNIFGNTVPS